MLHQVGKDRELQMDTEEYKMSKPRNLPAVPEAGGHDRSTSVSSDVSATNGDVEMKNMSGAHS